MKPTHHPIARIRALREPAVDDRRLDAAAPAFAQQVRPDLGLHHHEEPGPHEIERAAHEDAEVERKVKHRVDVGTLRRASACPVIVVVERNTRSRG